MQSGSQERTTNNKRSVRGPFWTGPSRSRNGALRHVATPRPASRSRAEPVSPSPRDTPAADAAAMPLPFNKTLDLKLLDLVKENPILYNIKHSKYLDFDAREVVWQKIGDALNRPGKFFTLYGYVNTSDFSLHRF